MATKKDDLHTIRPIVADANTKLAKIDTRSTCGFTSDKPGTIALLIQLNAQLAQLQDVMYAEGRRKVLVVLQAMDTGGKDGVIRDRKSVV